MGDGYITALLVEPEAAPYVDAVFAGTGRMGSVYYSSSPPGHCFYPADYGIHDPAVRTIAVEPIQPFSTDPEYAIYACTKNGLFKRINNSQDLKLRWTRLSNTGIPETELTTLVIGHLNTHTIYTAAGNAVVYKSTNGGIDWNNLSTPVSVSQLTIDPQNDSILYMIGGSLGSVYKTTNGGESWYLINYGLNQNTLYRQLVVDPLHSSTLYICSMHSTNGGIYKSNDGGEHWFSIKDGLPQWGVFTIAIDPVNTNNVYIVLNLFFSGIYKSTEGGKSWTQYTNGLENAVIEQLVIDPLNPNNLYAVDGGYGGNLFYRSGSGGQNWTAMTAGITGWHDYGTCIVIDPLSGPAIYAGTWNNGVWRYFLGNEHELDGNKDQ